MGEAINTGTSSSVWFEFSSKHGVRIKYLIDYVKKSKATKEDGGYALTIALKDKEYALSHGIDQDYIINAFVAFLSRDLIEPEPFRIVVPVPSSKPGNIHRAIDAVASKVNERFGNPIGLQYLVRAKEIESSHLGGSRDRSVHEDSIDAPHGSWIQGRHFLLIDDVATTCSSIEACRSKLLSAGAASVECAVFAKTFDDYYDSMTSKTFLLKRDRANEFLAKSQKIESNQLAVEHEAERPETHYANGMDSEMRELDRAARSGSVEAALELGKRLAESGERFGSKAIEYYRIAYDLGERRQSAFWLALYFSGEMNGVSPEGSIDVQAAERYYRESIAAGDRYASPNNLALLIKEGRPDEAIKLFKMAIDAGDLYYAPKNLADLIDDNDPESAKEFYEIASNKGNPGAMTILALKVEKTEPQRCIDLLEKAVLKGEMTYAAFNLAMKVKEFDRERAVSLLEACIESGRLENSVDNLALLLIPDELGRAIQLIWSSFKKGYLKALEQLYGFNSLLPFSFVNEVPSSPSEQHNPQELAALGVFWLGQHTVIAQQRAVEFFEAAINAGENVYSTCNLAMMLSANNPRKAIELYEESLNGNLTEAKLGLAWLLENEDPSRSEELLAEAYAAKDIGDSLWFIAEYLRPVHPERARDLFIEARKFGSKNADYSLRTWFRE